jgi:hypothetical protein
MSPRRLEGAFGLLITAAAAGCGSYTASSMFPILISVPLHLKTMFTWSTEYLTAFPVWYSLVERFD